MINVIALDDEPLALQQLTRYLGKVPGFSVVGSCLSVSEALKILNEQHVDAVFLDINMPDLNGMDFIKSLYNPPLVVFATAYSEYAIEGFKVNAVDYLLKPYGLADIQRAANKVKQHIKAQKALEGGQPQVPLTQDDAIFLKTDYKVVRIRIPDIVYIKGMSEYLRVYSVGQPKPVTALLSMKKIEEELSPRRFLRVHRSYIINTAHISEFGRSGIVLDTGEEIPVGDTYRTAVNDYVRRLTMNN